MLESQDVVGIIINTMGERRLYTAPILSLRDFHQWIYDVYASRGLRQAFPSHHSGGREAEGAASG